MTEAKEGESPYPLLQAHRRKGGHEKTYKVQRGNEEETICEECGEILEGQRAPKDAPTEQGVSA